MKEAILITTILLLIATVVLSFVELFYTYIKETILTRDKKKGIVLSTGIVMSTLTCLLIVGLMKIMFHSSKAITDVHKVIIALWVLLAMATMTGSVLNFWVYSNLTGVETDKKNKNVEVGSAIATLLVLMVVLVILSYYAYFGYKQQGGVFREYI